MPSSHDPVTRMFHCLVIVSKIPLFSITYEKLNCTPTFHTSYKSHNLSTRCVRNRFVGSLSTSCNNVVILSSCYKVVNHNRFTSSSKISSLSRIGFSFDMLYPVLSSLYVCMAIKHIIVLFVITPRKFITSKIGKPGSRITYY
jgi:hypothetical protein